MHTDKNILKKLLNDNLTSDERDRLNEGVPFSSVLEKQWTSAPDCATHDNADSQRIWSEIKGEVWDKKRVYPLFLL